MSNNMVINDISKEIMKDIRIVEQRLNHLDKEVVKIRTQLIIFFLFVELILGPLLSMFFSLLFTAFRTP